MPSASIPENEILRQKSLNDHQILDTMPQPEFDGITYLAAKICETPIALISLVDQDRQWFKSPELLAPTLRRTSDLT